MESANETFSALLRPLGNGMEAFLSSRSLLTYGIVVLVFAIIFRRSLNKTNCVDMDGLPMKEMNVSPKAATLFTPEISKKGEKLAHDEPYVIRDGNYHEVVLHTAEHVREFLRNDSKDHFRPENMGFGDYFYRVLGQCVGATSGEQWRVIRSYFDQAYTHGASLTLLSPFQKEVSKWLNGLKNDPLRTGVGRVIVHMPTSCKALTLRTIPLSFYGDAYDDDAYMKLDCISKLQAQALKYVVTGRWQKYKWFNVLPTPSRRHLDLYHQNWHAFNLEILENTRKMNITIPAEHAFKGVQENNAISMDQYLQTIDEMLFTNIEVTGSILTYTLVQLAKEQDYQQRLYEEVMAHKGEDNIRDYVTQQTTLLHYLTLESVRLRPATWFSAPDCITIDKVIGRYKIPAKTPVVIDVRRLNTNALTWGPDGAKFRPERFASLSPNEYRYGFMRFGVVSSKCLGKHMADLLMKVIIITILEQYKIEEVEMNIGVRDGDLALVKRNKETKSSLKG
ncbi:cytochrome P450 [Ustulina deusta]|nr:cytochrome P450 [Ustulina deusta]